MTATLTNGSEAMRRILLAIRVLIADDYGKPASRKDAAELRTLSNNPKERKMKLSELACLIITREHSRRATENNARYGDLMSLVTKLKAESPGEHNDRSFARGVG